MTDSSEIVLYQPDDAVKLEVRLVDETVWLSQAQMAELFGVKENNVTYHIQGIYKTHELEPGATTQKIRVVRQEGNRMVARQIDFYNLDMIISVGYRVNSIRGTQFRQWANRVLKDYLLKGYAINQRSVFTKSHDRFLIIDNDVYHIGASIKDLGKRWFAFCKMQVSGSEILGRLN